MLFTISDPCFFTLLRNGNGNKTLVALLIIFGSLIVIVIPFLSLSIMVIDKIGSIKKDTFPIQEWVDKIDAFASSHLGQSKLAENSLAKLGGYVTELFPSIISSAVNIVLTLLGLYFLLYFMLVQMKDFEAGLLKYAPFREQHALKFAITLRNSTYSNVLGQGIIAVIQGTLLAMGFYAFGIPDAIFWGVIGCFISFLPVVGAPTLCIPASIILFATGHVVKGVLLLIYGLLIIGNIDNVLRMLINRRIGNTHPIISVIGVFIGLPLFGSWAWFSARCCYPISYCCWRSMKLTVWQLSVWSGYEPDRMVKQKNEYFLPGLK